MPDWSRATGFDWDDGNARKSSDKHGVSQAEAEQIFFNSPLRVVPDAKHSSAEPRYHALGRRTSVEGCTLPSRCAPPAA
jgi:uncharacterized protein